MAILVTFPFPRTAGEWFSVSDEVADGAYYRIARAWFGYGDQDDTFTPVFERGRTIWND